MTDPSDAAELDITDFAGEAAGFAGDAAGFAGDAVFSATNAQRVRNIALTPRLRARLRGLSSLPLELENLFFDGDPNSYP